MDDPLCSSFEVPTVSILRIQLNEIFTINIHFVIFIDAAVFGATRLFRRIDDDGVEINIVRLVFFGRNDAAAGAASATMSAISRRCARSTRRFACQRDRRLRLPRFVLKIPDPFLPLHFFAPPWDVLRETKRIRRDPS